MLQFGERSQGRICAVNCWCIESAVELRDLGVWVYSSLKVVRQVDKVVMQVFGTFDFFGQSIERKSWAVILHLYKSFLSSHLEYCVQF